MAALSLHEIVTQMRWALLPPGGDVSDGQLLTRFIGQHDEAAFATLVKRHGPMVLGVCRRLLGNVHDADDAFQATFLILVRKAGSLKSCELVGNWLYGVAYNTALAARARNSRRRSKERQVTEMPEPAVAPPEDWCELRPLLDGELSRLADVYREAIVLCDLEGNTRREAAQKLGIAEGTLSGRLTTARRQLAKRLTRRGLALAGGAVVTAFARGAAPACVPGPLAASTVKAAAALATGSATAGAVPASVVALTEGVLKTMFPTKVKTLAVVVLAIFLAAGAVLVGHALAAPAQDKQEPKDKKDRPAQADPAKDRRTELDKLQGSWSVVGAEEKGEKIHEKGVKEAKETFVVKGGTMTYCRDGEVQVTMKIGLDPGKTPAAIDLEFADGNEKGYKNHAIYRLDGDTLKLRMNDKFGGNNEDERPTDFSTAKGKEAVLFILKRAKK
jgi:RNA polymerase sigma factor (sigma-70 family)